MGMNIQDAYEHAELTEAGHFFRVSRTGQRTEEETMLLREHKMKLLLNGETAAEFLCTYQYLPELALGHLLTEGFLGRGEKLSSFLINEDGTAASAEYRRQGFGCQNQDFRALRPLRKRPFKEEWIFALADKMAEGMPLHEQTWGTHSCFLAKEGELLFSCEDIGRHNAVDKAVGYALRNGIDLQSCILYSSGRMLSVITEKVIRAGIPIAACKAVPTAEAVGIAKRYGLTLIGAARPDRLRIYT